MRPLTYQMIDYAAQDVLHLVRLSEVLLDRISKEVKESCVALHSEFIDPSEKSEWVNVAGTFYYFLSSLLFSFRDTKGPNLSSRHVSFLLSLSLVGLELSFYTIFPVFRVFFFFHASHVMYLFLN